MEYYEKRWMGAMGSDGHQLIALDRNGQRQICYDTKWIREEKNVMLWKEMYSDEKIWIAMDTDGYVVTNNG